MTESSERSGSDTAGDTDQTETPLVDRVNEGTSTFNNFLAALVALGGVVGGAVGFLDKIPNDVRPFIIAALGICSLILTYRCFLVQTNSRAVRSSLRRRNIIFQTLVPWLVLTALAFVWLWPGSKGADQPQKDAKSPTSTPSLSAKKLSVVISEIKDGITSPDPSGDQIHACIKVSGVAKIPAGFQVWVMHRNGDKDGPTGELYFNVRQGNPKEGTNKWATDQFTVGSKSDVGKYFWIFLYLVPDSAGNVLRTLNDAPTLNVTPAGPPFNARLITTIPVIKNDNICPKV